MTDQKKLGFGLMRLPETAKGIDLEQLKQMVDAFMDAGFTYFDTAWMYAGSKSESAAKEALVDRYPREAFTLATKLHSGFFDSREGRDGIFNEQLARTGAGYFDQYLIHGVERASLPKFEELDCFDWLLDKKERGLVKRARFSFHDDAELLDEVLTKHPEMEFVQLQVNYLDWESPWIQARANCEVCRAHGKPIIVMEPVKGGTLAPVPTQAQELFRAADPAASDASWAIRFAASLPGVEMVLSGMSTIQQMEDNISFMKDFVPLAQEEMDLCFQVGSLINSQTTIACTACGYCVPGCPQDIPIPQYFSLFNEMEREDMEKKGWTSSLSTYGMVAADHGSASDCIACGACEAICPQHLPIISDLERVAEAFEPEA